jgi:hypothetical protein
MTFRRIIFQCRVAAYIDIVSPISKKFTLFPLLPAELRIKIWKLAICPRVVIKHLYYKGHGKPTFTPGIPVLMHTSVEARQIALEHFFTAEACPIPNLRPGLEGVLGPMTFNFELDTFLCLGWDGRVRSTSVNHPLRLLDQIIRQLRHLCISLQGFENIVFGHDFALPFARRAEDTYNFIKRFEKLETISLYGDMGPYAGDIPQEKILVDVKPESLFAKFDNLPLSLYCGSVRTWNNTQRKRSPHCYKEPLMHIERAHPDWKAPLIKWVRVDFRDLSRRIW